MSTPAIHRRIARDFAALLLAHRIASVDPVDLTDIPAPLRKAVVGPVVSDFAFRGFILDTETFERSRRPHAHGCPKRRWRLIDRRGLNQWLKNHPPLTPAPKPKDLFDDEGEVTS